MQHVLYLYGKHDIDGSNDIVVLGVDCTRPVNHGVGCTPLLSKVHDGIRFEASHNILKKFPVADIPYLEVNVAAGDLTPAACIMEQHTLYILHSHQHLLLADHQPSTGMHSGKQT